MSCDGNRGIYFSHIGAESRLDAAFGSTDNAAAALEQLFNTTRRQPTSDAEALMARTKTTAMFNEMRRSGITPPTHSATGLPVRDAQMGYAAVYDAIQAVRNGRPLSATATQIRRRFVSDHDPRMVAAPRVDTHGTFRCPNCGRYASRVRGHLCPQAATPATIARFLSRRLRVPMQSYDIEQLARLVDECQTDGVVRMRHALTGEIIGATLDGSLVALQQGYTPIAWADTTLVHTSNGQIVPVHRAGELHVVTPADSVFAHAAALYGVALDGSEAIDRLGVSVSAASAAIVGHEVAVTGGENYAYGRFIGSEYRRTGLRGQSFEVLGRSYVTGHQTTDPADRSSARHDTRAVVIGRTLVQAIDILHTSFIHRPTGTNRIELYTADQRELRAVYDMDTHTVGGITQSADGSPMTPEQVAAVLAGMYDAFPALRTDMQALHTGGSPIAAADSAYLSLVQHFQNGGALNFGATMAAEQCPQCGRFMGDVHQCPPAIPDVFTTNGTPRTLAITNRSMMASVIHAASGVTWRIDEIQVTPTGYEVVTPAGGVIALYDPQRNMTGSPGGGITLNQPNGGVNQDQLRLVLYHYAQNDPRLQELCSHARNYWRDPGLGTPDAISRQIVDHLRQVHGVDQIVMNAETAYGRCPDCNQFIGQTPHVCHYGGRQAYHEELLAYINAADEHMLQQLPDIGAVRARSIIQARQRANGQFSSIDHAAQAARTWGIRTAWSTALVADRIEIPDLAEALQQAERRRQRAAARPPQPTFEEQLAALPTTNLNTATVDEIARFPGISRRRAQQIVDVRQQRPFISQWEMMNRIPGFRLQLHRFNGRMIIGPAVPTPQPDPTPDPTEDARGERILGDIATAQTEVRSAVQAEYEALERRPPPIAERDPTPFTIETFQASYDAARERKARGEPPVPYVRENATGGLGAPGTGRGFGVEIEFVGGNTAAIGRDLHAAGLTSSARQEQYHSGQGSSQWRFERDVTVTGEIISPVLYDTPETWDQLELVCEIVRRNGGQANMQCGGHVHVGVSDYDHTPANHERLVRAYARNQDVIYRLSQNPDAPHHRGTNWCSPISEPSRPYVSATDPRVSSQLGNHHVGLNFQAVGGNGADHVEFRTFDESLDPAVIQSQIKFSLAMVTYAKNASDDEIRALPVAPRGHHRRQNPQGARLEGEAWDRQTAGFRTLTERIFTRPEDRDQMTALFAVTKWQR